jgi:type IV secretory pathway VirJ component
VQDSVQLPALARRARLLPALAALAVAMGAHAGDETPRVGPRRDDFAPAATRPAMFGATPHSLSTKSGARTHAMHDPRADRIVDVAGIGAVTLYAPRGQARGLALFASGDGGWVLGVRDMAHAATQLGYWVAGFSTPAFLEALENGDGECSDASALLDRLGARIRGELGLPADWRPVLIGYSSGATLMYAALAQAGDARFGGAMTLGFCPDLVIHKPFCAGAGLSADKQSRPPYGIVFNTVPAVPVPWIVLQGDVDRVCYPPATEAFVGQVRGGRVVILRRVGHGYSAPARWMRQFRRGLIDLLAAARPLRVAGVGE